MDEKSKHAEIELPIRAEFLFGISHVSAFLGMIVHPVIPVLFIIVMFWLIKASWQYILVTICVIVATILISIGAAYHQL